MFALIDCNNFYVSCERLFRPDLQRRAVAVLSNNDGCIIARSAEVKALGVAMGAPLFQVRDLLAAHRVAVFSSNYALYGDLSWRVMETLRAESPRLEVYSIDEAFVHVPSLPRAEWLPYGLRLRGEVGRGVGIPVSVGLASTRTLAKLAARLAKQRPDGVCALLDEGEVHDALCRTAVEDIWGIGRRYAARLSQAGVFTGADFVRLPEGWVQQEMTVVGLRTHRELRGWACLPLEEAPPPRRSMVYSRSLGQPVSDAETLRGVVARYASALGERLRRHRQRAGHLRLMLASPRRDEAPVRVLGRDLDVVTADSRDLVATAWSLLERLHRPGLRCQKAGVMALGLVAAGAPTQTSLLAAPTDPRLMEVVDGLNARFGRGTVRLGAEEMGQDGWQPRQEGRSPRYTTRWEEVPVIS